MSVNATYDGSEGNYGEHVITFVTSCTCLCTELKTPPQELEISVQCQITIMFKRLLECTDHK